MRRVQRHKSAGDGDWQPHAEHALIRFASVVVERDFEAFRQSDMETRLCGAAENIESSEFELQESNCAGISTQTPPTAHEDAPSGAEATS